MCLAERRLIVIVAKLNQAKLDLAKHLIFFKSPTRCGHFAWHFRYGMEKVIKLSTVSRP